MVNKKKITNCNQQIAVRQDQQLHVQSDVRKTFRQCVRKNIKKMPGKD